MAYRYNALWIISQTNKKQHVTCDTLIIATSHLVWMKKGLYWISALASLPSSVEVLRASATVAERTKRAVLWYNIHLAIRCILYHNIHLAISFRVEKFNFNSLKLGWLPLSESMKNDVWREWKFSCFWLILALMMCAIPEHDQEFFTGKIVRQLNFHLVLFLSQWPLDEINLLHLFTEKIFHLFNFRCWKWSTKVFLQWKFPNLHYKIFFLPHLECIMMFIPCKVVQKLHVLMDVIFFSKKFTIYSQGFANICIVISLIFRVLVLTLYVNLSNYLLVQGYRHWLP